MRFHVVEQGAGRPLLFLHGLGGNAETWRHQIEQFSATHRALAVDLPGYGLSEPLDQMTFPALAGWLSDLMITYDMHDAVIIGHSFGGMVLQEYLANDDGSSVTAAVLYATSPAFGRRDGEWQKAFVRKRLQPLEEGKTMRELAPDMARQLVGSRAAPAAVDLARRGLADVSDETFRAAVQCLVEFDQRANLGRIKIPTLVLAGEEDRNAPPAMMEKMARMIAAADFVCFAKTGHVAHLENPELFNNTLQDFLVQQR